MGAALATHRVDSTSPQWPLLREYVGYSLRSLSECASVFLGRSATGEEDVEQENLSGYLPSAYARYLTHAHFDEIFGMLVADAQPHFAFFQHAGTANVCAHHVFCSLVLLARADLHAKVQFLLRLYTTDAHGQLPTERRRMLLRDFLSAVPRVLSLTEPIEGSVVSYLEKELLARDDSSLGTSRELYDYCFTTARISSFLHEIQSIVHELALQRDKETSRIRKPTTSNAKPVVDSSRLKLLNRDATMYQLTHESLLWSMRAGDLPWLWRQDHVRLPDETLVGDALRVMKSQRNASAVLVLARPFTHYTGFLTLDDFLTFFVDLLPDDASSTPSMGEYMRIQVAKAGQLFAQSSLRTVVARVHDAATPRGRPCSVSSYQCVADDECFFNVLLRLACGAQAVAVLLQSSDSVGTREATPIDPLLGRVSVFDILEWLLEDLSLLNGKERFAIASFPGFYYTPTTFDIQPDTFPSQQRPWFLDAVVAMQMQRTTGVLITSVSSTLESVAHDVHALSAESLRAVFASDEHLDDDIFSDDVPYPLPVDALTPLQTLMDTVPHAFEPASFVEGDQSIAHAVHTMVTTKSRRVYIRDSKSQVIHGVVRATDILRLLLQEQHQRPRKA